MVRFQPERVRVRTSHDALDLNPNLNLQLDPPAGIARVQMKMRSKIENENALRLRKSDNFFMSTTDHGYAKKLSEQPRGLSLLQRARRVGENVGRRLMRKPRTVTESPNLLPLLIQVLAAFTKADGEIA